MKIKKDGKYIVQANGATNNFFWDGQKFGCKTREGATVVSGEQAEALTLGRKPNEVIVTPFTTALPSKDEAALKMEARHGKAIRGCCQMIIDKTVEVGRVYLDLCLYIRKNMVPMKLVSSAMTEMGFNRQVVSRVNKVANASDALWSEFEARTIGFNKVLELSRGGAVVGSLAKEMGSDVVDVKAQIEEMESEETNPEQKPLIEPTAEEKHAAALKQFESSAARVLSAAASMQIKKQKKVVGGNGYVLIVMVDKKFKPAAATTTVL